MSSASAAFPTDPEDIIAPLVCTDATSGDFDPSRTAAALEERLEQLRELAGKVDGEIEAAEHRVTSARTDSEKSITAHFKGQHEIAARMGQLDQRFKSVSSVAVRIGEQLAALDGLRQRAKDAVRLVRLFDTFNVEEQHFSLPSAFVEAVGAGHNGAIGAASDPASAQREAQLSEAQEQAALLMQQLQAVAAGLEEKRVRGTEDALIRIRSHMQDLTKRFISDFHDNSKTLMQLCDEDSRSNRSPLAMLADASALAQHAKAQAIPQHGAWQQRQQLLARLKHLATILTRLELHDQLSTAYVQSVMLTQFGDDGGMTCDGVQSAQQELAKLYARISSVCTVVQPIIRFVFPPVEAPKAFQKLISRIFEDITCGVQERLHRWLSQLRPDANQLVSTQLADDAVKAQASYLQFLCSAIEQTRELVDQMLTLHLHEHSSSIGAITTKSTTGKPAPLITRNFFTELIDSLFATYLSDAQELELELLNARCRTTIDDVWTSARTTAAAPSGSSELSFETLMSVVLKKSVTTRMLRFSSQAVTRARTMSNSEDSAHTLIVQLFKTSCGFVGETYLCSVAESAIHMLETHTKGHSRAPQQFFQVVRFLGQRVQQLHTALEEDVLPMLQNHPTAQTQCIECKRFITTQLEQHVANGLKIAVEALAKHVEHILSTQDKNDYMPKDDMIDGPTHACQSCIQAISEQYRELKDCLNESEVNLHMFWKNFGKRLSFLLRRHIHKFKINTMGGVVLLMDVDMYRQTVRIFNSTTIDSLFMQLHELVSTVFSLSPENLRAVIRDGQFAAFGCSAEEMQSLVRARVDIPKTELKRIFS